jgi:hypothetical protein
LRERIPREVFAVLVALDEGCLNDGPAGEESREERGEAPIEGERETPKDCRPLAMPAGCVWLREYGSARGFCGADVSRLEDKVWAAWDGAEESSFARGAGCTSGGSGAAGAGEREDGVSVIAVFVMRRNRALLEIRGRRDELLRHRSGQEGIWA